jgi:BirA family transcriptional regulator, biotin operon repressor / biotin---[acetyl-CoA-carboxylase] ligase
MPTDPAGQARTAYLETVDSTNAEALRRARAGERDPLWIVAREQSAGRGRRGRPWESPAGNLHATLLLTDPAPAAAAPQLGFVAALALHDAATACAPALDLALKWPNDLLCRRRKIGGILIEGEGAPIAAAVGVGVNCRAHPHATEYPATDFAAEGAEVMADALFARLAAAMEARLAQWDRGAGFAAIRAAWLVRADGLGQPIRVRLPEREASGVFAAIDAAGRLMLRHAGQAGDDGLEAIAAGEVFPLDRI